MLGTGALPDYSLRAIVDTINAPCKDEVCEVRAIYDWIVYNCKASHHPKQYGNSASGALNERKAVCGGYADLF